MGFFDNLKSSLAETGQDLSQKAKDTIKIMFIVPEMLPQDERKRN